MKKINNNNSNLLKNFYIKGSGNILTLLMLPIAFSLYDEIMLAGFDGRKKKKILIIGNIVIKTNMMIYWKK